MMNDFQKTSIGDIPKSWEVIKIENLLKEKRIVSHLDGNHGGLYPKSDEFIEEGVPYIGANSFLNGSVDFTKCKRLSMERSLKFKKGVAKNGDVLFAHNATVGPVAFLETDLDFVILSTTATYYRLDNITINAKYWMYYLSSPSFKNQYIKVMGQSTRNQVPITMQRTFYSILPPLPEQQKIAEILSTVDAKIDLITQRISQTQDLKKGLMQRLLTKGIGHTEFKDSPLGEIPKSWEVVKLGDTLSQSPEYGANASAGDFNNESYRYIRITDILENGKLTKEKIVGISKFEGKQYELEQNDILIARTGNTVGKSYLYDSGDGLCSFAGYLIRFKPNNEILNARYMIQYLHSEMFWNWIKTIVRTGAQPNVNSKEYQSMKLALPSITEQTQIANILSTVDIKLDVLQNKKIHYQELKKGLMQQLLTGKVRVTGLIKEVV